MGDIVENTIKYGYKYEKEYGIYLVRRIDGKPLYFYIPSGLFQTLIVEEERRCRSKLSVDSEDGYIYFDSEGKNAIVDFRRLSHTESEVDEIVEALEEKYMMPIRKEKCKVLGKIFNKR